MKINQKPKHLLKLTFGLVFILIILFSCQKTKEKYIKANSNLFEYSGKDPVVLLTIKQLERSGGLPKINTGYLNWNLSLVGKKLARDTCYSVYTRIISNKGFLVSYMATEIKNQALFNMPVIVDYQNDFVNSSDKNARISAAMTFASLRTGFRTFSGASSISGYATSSHVSCQ